MYSPQTIRGVLLALLVSSVGWGRNLAANNGKMMAFDPSFPKQLRGDATFVAPLTSNLIAQGRGSTTPTYSGGVVSGAGAVYYADDPKGTGLLVPTTSGAPVFTSQGYQGLGGIANLLTYSCAFDNAAWNNATKVTANSTISPDGTQNADTLTDNDAGLVVALHNGGACANDNTAHTFSVYFLKTAGTATFPSISIYISGGSSEVFWAINVNTDTGVIINRTGSTPTASTIASVGAYWKVSITGTNNTSGNTSVSGYVYPTVLTTWGAGATATVTGSCVCWGASLVNLAFPSPGHLMTAGASASRTKDNATWPLAGNLSTGSTWITRNGIRETFTNSTSLSIDGGNGSYRNLVSFTVSLTGFEAIQVGK